jgi:hypothetical protein
MLDKTTYNEITLDKTTLDKTMLDKTTLDKTTLDKTTLDKTTLDKTTLDKTTLDKTTLDKTTLEEMTLDKTALYLILANNFKYVTQFQRVLFKPTPRSDWITEIFRDLAVPSHQFQTKKNVSLDRVALPTQGLM